MRILENHNSLGCVQKLVHMYKNNVHIHVHVYTCTCIYMYIHVYLHNTVHEPDSERSYLIFLSCPSPSSDDWVDSVVPAMHALGRSLTPHIGRHCRGERGREWEREGERGREREREREEERGRGRERKRQRGREKGREKER